MVWGKQATFCNAALNIWMGWIRVAMKVEVEDKAELRIREGVPVELQRNSGGGGGGWERGVVGRGDGMAKRVLIRVQQDARGVVVPCTSMRVQSEDVWSDDALDVKVGSTHRSRGGCQVEGGHTPWAYIPIPSGLWVGVLEGVVANFARYFQPNSGLTPQKLIILSYQTCPHCAFNYLIALCSRQTQISLAKNTRLVVHMSSAHREPLLKRKRNS